MAPKRKGKIWKERDIFITLVPEQNWAVVNLSFIIPALNYKKCKRNNFHLNIEIVHKSGSCLADSGIMAALNRFKSEILLEYFCAIMQLIHNLFHTGPIIQPVSD